MDFLFSFLFFFVQNFVRDFPSVEQKREAILDLRFPEEICLKNFKMARVLCIYRRKWFDFDNLTGQFVQYLDLFLKKINNFK